MKISLECSIHILRCPWNIWIIILNFMSISVITVVGFHTEYLGEMKYVFWSLSFWYLATHFLLHGGIFIISHSLKSLVVNISRILMALNEKVLQDIKMKKIFENVYFNAKIYWISSALLWNSTTVITLMSAYVSIHPFKRTLARLWN